MLITFGTLSFDSPSAQVYHPCREFQEFPVRTKMVPHGNDSYKEKLLDYIGRRLIKRCIALFPPDKSLSRK